LPISSDCENQQIKLTIININTPTDLELLDFEIVEINKHILTIANAEIERITNSSKSVFNCGQIFPNKIIKFA